MGFCRATREVWSLGKPSFLHLHRWALRGTAGDEFPESEEPGPGHLQRGLTGN